MNRFFILGNPRSGTTLLRLMLNRHPEMVVPPEAGFLVWFYHAYNRPIDSADIVDEFLRELSESWKIHTWQLDFNSLRRRLLGKIPLSYTEMADEIYAAYAVDVLGRNRLVWYGDKNNFYLDHVETLATMYPDAKFIHLVRDGRSIAVSYRNLKKKEIQSRFKPQLPVTIAEIAGEWSRNVTKVYNDLHALANQRSLVVKFEALVQDPKSELDRLCRFLGIDFQERMFEFYRTRVDEGREPEDFMAWKAKTRQPVMPGEATKYLALDKHQRAEFERLAEKALRLYGYI